MTTGRALPNPEVRGGITLAPPLQIFVVKRSSRATFSALHHQRWRATTWAAVLPYCNQWRVSLRQIEYLGKSLLEPSHLTFSARRCRGRKWNDKIYTDRSAARHLPRVKHEIMRMNLASRHGVIFGVLQLLVQLLSSETQLSGYRMSCKSFTC